MVHHQLIEVESPFFVSSTLALNSFLEVRVALQGTRITLMLIYLALIVP